MQHFQSIKRTGKSDESSISLPVQLGTPGGMYSLGVKIRNLKVDFKTGGTWRRAMSTDNEYLCFLFDLVV